MKLLELNRKELVSFVWFVVYFLPYVIFCLVWYSDICVLAERIN